VGLLLVLSRVGHTRSLHFVTATIMAQQKMFLNIFGS